MIKCDPSSGADGYVLGMSTLYGTPCENYNLETMIIEGWR